MKLAHLLEVMLYVGSKTYDLSNYVTQATWTKSVSAPWSTIGLSLKSPDKQPRPGNWIVLARRRKGMPPKTLAWGHVQSVTGGEAATSGGFIITKPISVSVESWLSYLGKVQVVASPTMSYSVGTLFTMRDWNAMIAVAARALTDNTGEALEMLMRFLPRVMLPQSLGGIAAEAPEATDAVSRFRALRDKGTEVFSPGSLSKTLPSMKGLISDSVRVVYDDTSAKAFTANRKAEKILGPSVSGLRLVPGAQGHSVLDLILGTFGADANMIEMFESLEDPGSLAYSTNPLDSAGAPSRGITAPDSGLTGPGAPELTFTTGQIQREDQQVLRDHIGRNQIGNSTPSLVASPPAKRLVSGPATVLGMNPVLIYRMRPWRAQSLCEYVTNGMGYEASRLATNIWNDITWDLGRAKVVTRNEIISVDVMESDAEYINAATVSLPFSPEMLKWRQLGGLPIAIRKNVIRYGPRIFDINWPFLPPIEAMNSDAERAKWLQWQFTVAAQGYQFMVNADRFGVGSASLGFRTDLDVGEPIVLQTRKYGTVAAYLESVTGSVTVGQNGAIEARTDLKITRALSDERFRTVTGKEGDENNV